MSSQDEDDSETTPQTTEEDNSNSRGSRIRVRGSSIMVPRVRGVCDQVRVGKFRPILQPSKAKCKYRTTKHAPPAALLDLLEGKGGVEEGYEIMLRAQVLGFFENFANCSLPTISSKDESPALAAVVTETPPRKHTRTKSTTGTRSKSVLKENVSMGVLELEPAGVVTVREVLDEIKFILDVAESLMLIENLSWPGLFQMRYLLTNRTLKGSELDHIKALVECFLANTTNNSGENLIRRQASKLMQYILSHASDIDGCLVGMRPALEIERKLTLALSKVYGEKPGIEELKDKILAFEKDTQKLCILPSSALSHGMILIANVANFGWKFVRFARIDPTKSSTIQCWINPFEKKVVFVDIRNGVFAMDEEMGNALKSNDILNIGSLVFNPLTPLKAEVNSFLNGRMDTYLKGKGVDMFLLNLTEEQLTDESTDWSKYSENGEKISGQAFCTKLLSLFDAEKKKLLQVRSTINQSELESIVPEVVEMVEAFMVSVNASDIFPPIRSVEIESSYMMGLKSVAAFQQTMESRMGQLEALIDFVIVNWKQLSDANGKKTMLKTTAKPRTFSRGTVKNMGFGSKDDLNSSGSIKGQVTPGTPNSKKKGVTLRQIFQKKE